jgi:hypothetical protein
MANEIFAIPPEEQMRKLQAKLESFQSQLDEIRKMDLRDTVDNRDIDTLMVAFQKKDGTTVYLQKHVKRNFTSTSDRDETIENLVNQLKKNGVRVTTVNISRMGIGRGTFSDYNNKKPLKQRKGKKRERESDVDRVPVEDDQPPVKKIALVESDSPEVPLPPGTKVIISGKNPIDLNTKLKRNIAWFGEENVIQQGECDGKIEKNVTIPNPKVRGRDFVRDLCVTKEDSEEPQGSSVEDSEEKKTIIFNPKNDN